MNLSILTKAKPYIGLRRNVLFLTKTELCSDILHNTAEYFDLSFKAVSTKLSSEHPS